MSKTVLLTERADIQEEACCTRRVAKIKATLQTKAFCEYTERNTAWALGIFRAWLESRNDEDSSSCAPLWSDLIGDIDDANMVATILLMHAGNK